jgi:hypothetical protein
LVQIDVYYKSKARAKESIIEIDARKKMKKIVFLKKGNEIVCNFGKDAYGAASFTQFVGPWLLTPTCIISIYIYTYNHTDGWIDRSIDRYM